MKLRTLFCALALAAPLPVLASQASYPASSDQRIRFIDYDPYNIPVIYAKVGGDFLLVFQNGEKIEDMGGGNTDAWGLGVSTAGNSVFMKPKLTSPNMNLHVLTNRRIYSIDLKLASKGQMAYETVFYRYPDDERAARAAADQRQQAQNLLKYGGGAAFAKNNHYTMQGSDDIAPSGAWDNGTFTYFTFPAHHDIPAIYYVGEDGKEHLVTKDTDSNDVVVVHKIARKFVLRSGDLVTCVFNEGFDPIGQRNPTNTSSPQVERVIKGGE